MKDQLELQLLPDWQLCKEHSGYLSLAGEAPGEYCTHCEVVWVTYIPEAPEVIGYVSAVWKYFHDQHPERYTVTR